MIVHLMRKDPWAQVRRGTCYGASHVEGWRGFVHCSPVEYLWRVAPNFLEVSEDLVLLCIEEGRLESEVRWEDDDGVGRCYPHVYGCINLDAVTAVLPFLRDGQGHWRKNPELMAYPDR